MYFLFDDLKVFPMVNLTQYCYNHVKLPLGDSNNINHVMIITA